MRCCQELLYYYLSPRIVWGCSCTQSTMGLSSQLGSLVNAPSQNSKAGCSSERDVRAAWVSEKTMTALDQATVPWYVLEVNDQRPKLRLGFESAKPPRTIAQICAVEIRRKVGHITVIYCISNITSDPHNMYSQSSD